MAVDEMLLQLRTPCMAGSDCMPAPDGGGDCVKKDGRKVPEVLHAAAALKRASEGGGGP